MELLPIEVLDHILEYRASIDHLQTYQQVLKEIVWFRNDNLREVDHLQILNLEERKSTRRAAVYSFHKYLDNIEKLVIKRDMVYVFSDILTRWR